MQFPAPIDSLLQRLLPAWVDRSILAKAICFAFIGCINATIHLTVFWIGYRLLGLWIVVANIIAWCIAVTNSYVMNSMFTFAEESGRRLSIRGHLTFAATQVAGLIANTLTIYIVASILPAEVAKFFGIDPVMIGAVTAIAVSFVVDFTLSHLIVFRRNKDTPPQDQQGDMRGSQ
jgi:putative flippase GtrA